MFKWRTYIPCLILLAAGMACSSQDDASEVLEPGVMCIAGTTLPLVESRATEDMSHDYKMWVAAIYHSQYNDKHEYYFATTTEKKFVWSDDVAAWKADNEDLYYPLSGSIDFLAYAIVKDSHKPSSTFSPATLTDANSTFTDMTLDFGTALDGTAPVVISDIITRQCNLEVEKPLLQFRHTMAKIVFTLRTDDSTTASQFRLCQLTVRDVKTSGILHVTAKSAYQFNGVSGGSEFEWQSLSVSQSVSLMADDTTVAPLKTTNLGRQVGSALYLPLQGEAPRNVEVELAYKYTSFPSGIDPEKIVITLPNVDWQPGCQYNYIINCKVNQIDVVNNGIDVIIDSNPIDINLDEQYQGDTLIK